jgi:hypothetical protein
MLKDVEWKEKLTPFQKGRVTRLLSKCRNREGAEYILDKIINDLLTQLESEVEGMEKTEKHVTPFFGDGLNLLDSIYNEALKDVINLIKKYRK